jgi:hypothetical protein
MKSLEEQIAFVDKKILPLFGIKSIIDYDSTFEITSDIDLISFNTLISEFRKVFPVKEFSLHKTKYVIETSNQALCILKKCMELIQLPFTIDTLIKNKMSFKQLRLIQTNVILYKYIQKMSEIRSQKDGLNSSLFNDHDSTIGTKSNNLINSYRPIGVNTVGTNLKNGQTHDIGEIPPNPKYIVSPWHTSSYEPDSKYDLKPDVKIQEKITLKHSDLINALQETKTYTSYLSCQRLVNSDGICHINLKQHELFDKYLNSIKCNFFSKKYNGDGIMSNYYINSMVSGIPYHLLIGGQVVTEGTFYNGKELLPLGEDTNTMLLLTKILKRHDVILKLFFDKSNVGGFKYIELELTTQLVSFDSDINESLIDTVGHYIFKEKKHNFIGVEQLIKNEKELYNKSRIMCGMAGNAYCEFTTKERMIELETKYPELSGEYTKKMPKDEYQIGKFKGYKNSYLQLPEDSYDFCSYTNKKIYTNIDTNILYSYIKLENDIETKYTHYYEIFENNSPRFSNMNDPVPYQCPYQLYAMSNININLDSNIILNKDNLKMYILGASTYDNLELIKFNLNFTLCDSAIMDSVTNTSINYRYQIMLNDDVYALFTNLIEFKGILVEVLSNSSNEPIEGLLEVDKTLYAFNNSLRRALASTVYKCLFDLNKYINCIN